MKRPHRWILGIAVSVISAVVLFAIYVRHADEHDAIVQARANAKQMALSLRCYARDHDGKLPASLSALTGDGGYLHEWLAYEAQHYCTLKCPNEVWEKLATNAVVLEFALPRPQRTIRAYPDLHTDVTSP